MQDEGEYQDSERQDRDQKQDTDPQHQEQDSENNLTNCLEMTVFLEVSHH